MQAISSLFPLSACQAHMMVCEPCNVIQQLYCIDQRVCGIMRISGIAALVVLAKFIMQCSAISHPADWVGLC